MIGAKLKKRLTKALDDAKQRLKKQFSHLLTHYEGLPNAYDCAVGCRYTSCFEVALSQYREECKDIDISPFETAMPFEGCIFKHCELTLNLERKNFAKQVTDDRWLHISRLAYVYKPEFCDIRMTLEDAIYYCTCNLTSYYLVIALYRLGIEACDTEIAELARNDKGT